MRLPVVKVLWGMFAFPSLYPAQMFGAAALPLIAVIGTTLAWIARPPELMPSASTWALLLLDWFLYAWLAVRVHRAVLLGEHGDAAAHRLRCVANYFWAIVAAQLAWSLFFAIVFIRYVPTGGAAEGRDGFGGLPAWISWSLQLGPIYLAARLSPALPAFALGRGWKLGEAWRTSRGNGWRLFAVVLLVPWAFGQIVDVAYEASGGSMAVAAVLAVIKALLTTLAVIALSLAYRELTATPGRSPTTPPA